MSRVLLEAAALGVPIAAMDTGGTSDIIRHRETGLLSATADALARDLESLIADPALASRLGTAASGHVERTFNQSTIVERTMALYAELIDRERARVRRA